jgi:PAS domain S-box-containing protein
MAKEGEKPEERTRGLAALCAITEAISGSLDLDETLNKALEKVMEFLGVEIGAIFLLDDQKRQAKLMVQRGLSEKSVQSLNTLRVNERVIKALTKEGKRGKWVVIIEEALKRTRLLKDIKAAIARERAQSYLPILVRSRQDILGGMIVASREPREFTPEQIGLSIAVGRQIGVAIENARLYQEQRHQLEEHKRAEEALREVKEFSDDLIASMQDGFSVLDSRGVHIDVNSALCQITGFSREELIGVGPPHPYWPPEAYGEIERAFQKTLRGQFANFELTFMRKNGERFPVIVSPSWIKDEQGNPVSYFATVKDITERKRAEETLRETRDYLESLINYANAPIIVWDAGGRITRFNLAFEDLTGYTADEVIGQELSMLFPEASRSESLCKIARTSRGEYWESVEIPILRKDGEIRLALWNSANIYAEDGTTLLATIAQGIDITDRKRAKEALQRLNRQLAALLEIAASLETTASPTELATNLVHALADRLGYPFVGIWLLEGNVLKRVAEVGYYAEPLLSEFAEIPLEQGIIGRVARTGQPAYVPDVSQDSDFRGLADIRSEICCPLQGTGGLLGVLDVESCETLTEADFALVQAAARLSATALSDAQLFGASRRQAEELAALYDVSLDIAAQLEIQQLLQTIVERAIRLLDAKGGGIYLYDPAKREVELQVSYGLSKDYTGTRLALGEGLSGKVAETGEPLMVDDYQRWEGRSPLWEGEAIGGVLGIPLKRGDDLLGVLTIDHAPGTNFQEGDSRLATLFANQAAIAIENARLFNGAQQRIAELATINQIGRAIASTMKLDQLWELIYHQTCRVMEVSALYIALYDQEREELQSVIDILYRQRRPKEERPRKFAKGRTEHIIRTKNPLLIRGDVQETYRRLGIVSSDKRARAFAGVPIAAGDEVIGVLAVQNYERDDSYDEHTIELLSTIANQAAIAIENARLYEQTDEKLRHRVAELTALNAIARSLTRSLELDAILKSIVMHVAHVMQARICTIRLVEGDQLTIGAAVGYRGESSRQHTIKIDKRLARIVRDQQPLLVEDLWQAEDTPPSRRERAKQEGVHSFIGVPMISKGETIGVLSIYGEKPHRFTEGEISLLLTIANQAAIAIENARLYERAIESAEAAQRRAERLQSLQEANASLTSTLDLEEVLRRIAGEALRNLKTQGVYLLMMNEKERTLEGNVIVTALGESVLSTAERLWGSKLDELKIPLSDKENWLIQVLTTGEARLGVDLTKMEGNPVADYWREFLKEMVGTSSISIAPLRARDKILGVMLFATPSYREMSEEDRKLIETYANQAALAIENARLYERVRKHAEELERLVQERTQELQAIHAELLQSAKLAALGQLAAGVAHELNNPLGAISGYLELLQEEMELGPQEMDYMERIEKRIQQSTKIVAELKSLGAPSEPVWQIVNVNDILEGTLSLVERRLSFHQIKVQKDITPALPLMHADPDRLEQVFINLITNARQAMEEGGTLRVASRESRNGEWVEIIFADTGEGIAKEHLDKIFDPFFTTRSPGKGMGLGLSLSHRQIKDHGGAIDVWSEKGRGTVFRVALPPSGAKRCWEILDCDKKERCKAVRENADYRCWSVVEDVSRCRGCEVYRKKALLPLDGTLLPQ